MSCLWPWQIYMCESETVFILLDVHLLNFMPFQSPFINYPYKGKIDTNKKIILDSFPEIVYNKLMFPLSSFPYQTTILECCTSIDRTITNCKKNVFPIHFSEFSLSSFCRVVDTNNYSNLRVLRLDANKISPQDIPTEAVLCLRLATNIDV